MVPSVSPTELIKRLDEARARVPAGAVIATDGDGTLWRGDIGDQLFLAALRDRALRLAAREALLAEAVAHGIDVQDTDDANDLAQRLLDGLHAGQYDEERAFGMMAWAFAGWSSDELVEHARQVLDAFGFEAAVRAELRPVLGWAQDQGVPVWLVSASPVAVAAEAGRRLGIAKERVVAMDPAMEGDVIQPRLGRCATYGDGKLERLREATSAPLLTAFGDSGYDAAMLRVAELPVAVFPNSQLRALAPQLPGLVVVGDR